MKKILFPACVAIILFMIMSCDQFKSRIELSNVDGRAGYYFTEDSRKEAENCLAANYGVVKTIIATEAKDDSSGPNSRTVYAIKLYNENVQLFNSFYNEHKQFIKIDDGQLTQYACAP